MGHKTPNTRTAQLARQYTQAQLRHKLAAAEAGEEKYPGAYVRLVAQRRAALEIRVTNGWS